MNDQLIPRARPTGVLVVLGTRPEAIKLAPVINELRRYEDVMTRVCVTGQHREMVQPILELFDVRPDIDLLEPPAKISEPQHRAHDAGKRTVAVSRRLSAMLSAP